MCTQALLRHSAAMRKRTLSRSIERVSSHLVTRDRELTLRSVMRTSTNLDALGLATVFSSFVPLAMALVAGMEGDLTILANPAVAMPLLPWALVASYQARKRAISSGSATPEVVQALLGLAGVARRAEELDDSPARTDLLAAIEEAGAAFVAVGHQLAAAGEADKPEVERQHQDLKAAVGGFALAQEALAQAQETRRKAFLIKSDLSPSAAAVQGVRVRAQEAVAAATRHQGVEEASLAEVKVAAARGHRTVAELT